MNKEEIRVLAEALLVQLEKGHDKLIECLGDVAVGEQSLEYLDAIYATIREDAAELGRLAGLFKSLEEEEKEC